MCLKFLEKKDSKLSGLIALAVMGPNNVMRLDVATLYAEYDDEYVTIPCNEMRIGATVRIAIVNGVRYLSLRDLMMLLFVIENKEVSRKWNELSIEAKHDILPSCYMSQFPGRGQTKQPVITLPGALKVIMYFSGEHAKRRQDMLVNILDRHFAERGWRLKALEANPVSDEEAGGDRKVISLTDVAKQMGRSLTHGELCRVGRAVLKKYRARYDVKPRKHLPGRPNRNRMMYTTKDRDLIEEAIADVVFVRKI